MREHEATSNNLKYKFMTKLFKITGFEKEEHKVFVFLQNGLDADVDVDDFHNFLERHDKLEYCKDYEVNGEHQQDTGKMDYAQYWSNNKRYIMEDLYEYLVIKRFSPNTIKKGLLKLVDNITKEFKNKLQDA